MSAKFTFVWERSISGPRPVLYFGDPAAAYDKERIIEKHIISPEEYNELGFTGLVTKYPKPEDKSDGSQT